MRRIFIYIYFFFSNALLIILRRVENLQMGRARDVVSTTDFVKSAWHSGYYVARVIERYVHGRYLEVDAAGRASERAKSVSFKQAERSKQLEIRKPARRFNSAIWTNFCADTHSWCFIPDSFYRSCARKRKEKEREKEERGREIETMLSRGCIHSGRYSFAAVAFAIPPDATSCRQLPVIR